jgi:hypothetical protein
MNAQSEGARLAKSNALIIASEASLINDMAIAFCRRAVIMS